MLGVDEPKYIVHGEDIMVKFSALPRVKLMDSKAPKHQNTGALENESVQRIIKIIRQKPGISQSDLADELGTTRRVIQKNIAKLKEMGILIRIGGKRYGHWKVKEDE